MTAKTYSKARSIGIKASGAVALTGGAGGMGLAIAKCCGAAVAGSIPISSIVSVTISASLTANSVLKLNELSLQLEALEAVIDARLKKENPGIFTNPGENSDILANWRSKDPAYQALKADLRKTQVALGCNVTTTIGNTAATIASSIVPGSGTTAVVIAGSLAVGAMAVHAYGEHLGKMIPIVKKRELLTEQLKRNDPAYGKFYTDSARMQYLEDKVAHAFSRPNETPLDRKQGQDILAEWDKVEDELNQSTKALEAHPISVQLTAANTMLMNARRDIDIEENSFRDCSTFITLMYCNEALTIAKNNLLDEKSLGKMGWPSLMGQHFYNGEQSPICCYQKCITLFLSFKKVFTKPRFHTILLLNLMLCTRSVFQSMCIGDG